MVTDARDWPDDLHGVLRDYLVKREEWSDEEKLKFGSALNGYPRFYVVVDGKLDTTALGLKGWREVIAPRLTELVRAKTQMSQVK